MQSENFGTEYDLLMIHLNADSILREQRDGHRTV